MTTSDPSSGAISIDNVGRDVHIQQAGQDIVHGDKHVFYGTNAPQIPWQHPPRAPHFTGRQQELAHLLRDLQPGRVVTLCGPGGIGKSALAAEAVGCLEPDRFPDGVIFHTFYGQPDPDLALEHIARSYGLDPQPTPATAALRALAGKRALLLLDGAEEADNLAAVLNIRGDCGVLITSRQRTDAVDERQDLPPLPDAEAVMLLRDLGGDHMPDDAAQRICGLLGGLPLAIMIAGRYLNTTDEPAAEYLDWLAAQPLNAVHRGDHRHDSVNVLLARSLTQVSDDARNILPIFGLLAFAPVSRDVIVAAMEISSSPGMLHRLKRLFIRQQGKPQIDVKKAVNDLVNYGLLIRADDRYAVSHALIHTYARACCPAPEDVIDRLAAHYTTWAREQSQQGVTGYAQLDRERVHLLRILETCQEREQWEAVSDLVKAIGKYLDIRGHWTERQTALEMNLFAAQKQENRRDEGWCAGELGYNATKRGDYAMALTYLEQSLAIRRAIGDKAGEGTTLNNLSQIYKARGEYATALTYLDQSLAIQRDIGDKAGEGATLNNLSQIYKARGDYATALTYLDQSLAIQRDIGDKAGEGTTLNNLSQIYTACGDYATALTYVEQSLAICRAIGDKAGEGTTLNNLSQIYDARGDYATALTYLEQSLAICRAIGDKAGEGVTCWNIGMMYAQQGDLVQAEKYMSRTVQIDEETGHPDLENDRAMLEQIRQTIQQQ